MLDFNQSDSYKVPTEFFA